MSASGAATVEQQRTTWLGYNRPEGTRARGLTGRATCCKNPAFHFRGGVAQLVEQENHNPIGLA